MNSMLSQMSTPGICVPWVWLRCIRRNSEGAKKKHVILIIHKYLSIIKRYNITKKKFLCTLPTSPSGCLGRRALGSGSASASAIGLTPTSFIDPFSSFCYITMSFNPKNMSLPTVHAEVLIDSNVGAYINDIVVKSRNADQRTANLEKTFTNFWGSSMKLNPKK